MATLQTALAIPAKRVFRTVTQPDGEKLQVTLCGDETFHYYSTPDGTPVHRNADGRWVRDLRDVHSLWTEGATRRAAQRRQLAQKMRPLLMRDSRGRRNAPAATQEIQQKKGLVILVNFSDKRMVTPEAQIATIYDQILNSEGNPYGRNHGSVHEYFLDQSYGELHVTFDIAGPVTMPKTLSYYGQDVNNSGTPSSSPEFEGNDAHPGEMVYEALKAIQNEVNFADYDWDGDGEVENVYVIYAGYAQSSGASSNTIWPHQWNLDEAFGKTFSANGVKVDTYACGSELADVSGSTLDGIGTMCHEFSHCLGLPDFYDTEGDNFGMSAWSVMDYGCYSGDGFCPAAYTAYERMYSGWLTPTELNAKTRVTDLKPIEDEPQAYIIYNDANHDEYYLLANHQKQGWDSEAYGHGMLVLHVDYDRSAWEENTINNTASRQRMTIIPADNKLSLTSYETMRRELGGDPYPGNTNNHELTDTSTPKASLYRSNTDGKKLMHKAITNISESNGIISFNFMSDGSELVQPTIDTEPVATTNAFTAAWNAVEGAVSYNLQYRTVTNGEGDEPGGQGDIEEALTLYESCLSFYVPDGQEYDGSTDISSQLDDYTDSPGWTGEKIYQGLYGAKLGSSNAGGRMTSPSFKCTTGEVTVYLWCYDWISADYTPDNTRPTVALIKPDGTQLTQQITPDDYYGILVRFSNVPASCKISIYTTSGRQRFYLDYILAFDGVFTIDEIEDTFTDDSDWDWGDDWYLSPARKHRAQRLAKRFAPTTTYGEWQTVSGITTTSHTVTALTSGTTYEYRVQAVDAEGNTSPWSDTKQVTLQPETAVRSIAVTTSTAEPVYDLSGRRISSQLSPGIYIRNGRKHLIR